MCNNSCKTQRTGKTAEAVKKKRVDAENSKKTGRTTVISREERSEHRKVVEVDEQNRSDDGPDSS